MTYNFDIKTVHGERRPVMQFTEEVYKPLENLATDYLATAKGVQHELSNLSKVVKGDLATYNFADNDWCIVEVQGVETTINNGFNEYQPIALKTEDLIKLLEDWFGFLITNKFE